MKILVIAPHPDDEVLGCGGTIVKYSQKGDEVYLCIVTKAYTPDWSEEFLKNRPREINESRQILGIEKVYFLDFPTAKLDTIPQRDLNDSILKVINEVNPELVFLPFIGDVSRDHRLVYEAALVATRPIQNSSIKKILCYETLSETEWGKSLKEFSPNVYEDISETFEKKIEATKIYATEIKEYPHPRSLEIIEALAKKRGSEVGVKLAEAFILIREKI